jgi:hypothetical protein
MLLQLITKRVVRLGAALLRAEDVVSQENTISRVSLGLGNDGQICAGSA